MQLLRGQITFNGENYHTVGSPAVGADIHSHRSRGCMENVAVRQSRGVHNRQACGPMAEERGSRTHQRLLATPTGFEVRSFHQESQPFQ